MRRAYSANYKLGTMTDRRRPRVLETIAQISPGKFVTWGGAGRVGGERSGKKEPASVEQRGMNSVVLSPVVHVRVLMRKSNGQSGRRI